MLLLPGAFKIWKLIVCTQVPHQHGYVAEPMSQEEHDQIAQYLTICEWQIVVDQNIFEAKSTYSSAIGGDKQNAWWIGGTDLHHEVYCLF